MKNIKTILETLSPLRTLVALGLLFSSHSVMANDRVSAIFENIGDEVSIIAPIFLLIVAGAGVCIAGWAVISGIMEKKKNQPLTWQVGGVIGGSLAVIVPLFIFAFTGSMSGGDSEAANMLNNLNVDY